MWQTPHARKSAARGPILPKSKRNFRQPPYVKSFLNGNCMIKFEIGGNPRPRFFLKIAYPCEHELAWLDFFCLQLWLLLALMAEVLHQLIGSLSHCVQGFIDRRWCRISSINSMGPSGVYTCICPLLR